MNDEHYERVIDAVADLEPARAVDVAARAGVDHWRAREVLLDAERRGCVGRTGRTKGTRWHLG